MALWVARASGIECKRPVSHRLISIPVETSLEVRRLPSRTKVARAVDLLLKPVLLKSQFTYNQGDFRARSR